MSKSNILLQTSRCIEKTCRMKLYTPKGSFEWFSHKQNVFKSIIKTVCAPNVHMKNYDHP